MDVVSPENSQCFFWRPSREATVALATLICPATCIMGSPEGAEMPDPVFCLLAGQLAWVPGGCWLLVAAHWWLVAVWERPSHPITGPSSGSEKLDLVW